MKKSWNLLWSKYRTYGIVAVIATVIFSFYITGLLARYTQNIFAVSADLFSFLGNIAYAFRYCAGVGFTFLFFLLCVEFYYFSRAVSSETETELSYEKADKLSIGTSEWASEEEIAQHFDVVPPKDATGLIIGWDGEKNVYCKRKKDRIVGTNEHMAIIGKSGIGKSFTFLSTAIYQCIKNGYSAFITDPAGELYETTAAIARRHGYDVKALVIRSAEEFYLSDSFNPIDNINGNYAKAVAVARTIIYNYATKVDVWAQFAQSLLVFLILYVDEQAASSEVRGSEAFYQKCNLGQVKEIMINGINHVKALMRGLSKDHVAYGSAKEFLDAEDKQQVPAFRNLNDAMNYFNDKNVRKLTTYPDIDVTKPGTEKCLYYLIISDTERAFDFLSALLYTKAFTELEALAQKQPNRLLPRKVVFILEEFVSAGYISNISNIAQNIRKYNMDLIICLQYYMQLEEHGYSKFMLDAFDTTLFLGTNTPENAEFIMRRLGDTTKKRRTRTVSKNKYLNKESAEYTETETEEKRPLLSMDDIMVNLNRGTEPELNEVVISFRCAPFIRKTFPRTYHPYEKEREDIKLSNYIPKHRLRELKNRPLYDTKTGERLPEETIARYLYKSSETKAEAKTEVKPKRSITAGNTTGPKKIKNI